MSLFEEDHGRNFLYNQEDCYRSSNSNFEIELRLMFTLCLLPPSLFPVPPWVVKDTISSNRHSSQRFSTSVKKSRTKNKEKKKKCLFSSLLCWATNHFLIFLLATQWQNPSKLSYFVLLGNLQTLCIFFLPHVHFFLYRVNFQLNSGNFQQISFPFKWDLLQMNRSYRGRTFEVSFKFKPLQILYSKKFRIYYSLRESIRRAIKHRKSRD